MRFGLLTLVGALLATPVASAPLWQPGGAPQEPRPVFKSGVSRVAVAVTVRTKRGRPVTNLTASDFQLFDSGEVRPIVDFRTDSSPLTLSLLVDFSGSMDVAVKREAAIEVSRHLLGWLTPEDDRVGVYTFDRTLKEVLPLSRPSDEVLAKMRTIRPYGKTSLFDAIAEAGRMLAATGARRRAVVVLTDGADNASQLSAAEVSGLASAIDVPVYIVLVISPLDRAGRSSSSVIEDSIDALVAGRLGDLARWTGGDVFAPVGPSDTSVATRQVVTELRHQYLIAFEPGGRPGWHQIDLRTRDKDHVVRARTGYIVNGPNRPDRF